jgi:hypothetical protein
MWKLLAEKSNKSKYVILAIIVAFQVALFLGFKFYFFATFLPVKN